MSVGTQKILDSIKHISPSAAFFCAAPSSVDEANEQIAMSNRKALVAQEQRARVVELVIIRNPQNTVPLIFGNSQILPNPFRPSPDKSGLGRGLRGLGEGLRGARASLGLEP